MTMPNVGGANNAPLNADGAEAVGIDAQSLQQFERLQDSTAELRAISYNPIEAEFGSTVANSMGKLFNDLSQAIQSGNPGDAMAALQNSLPQLQEDMATEMEKEFLEATNPQLMSSVYQAVEQMLNDSEDEEEDGFSTDGGIGKTFSDLGQQMIQATAAPSPLMGGAMPPPPAPKGNE